MTQPSDHTRGGDPRASGRLGPYRLVRELGKGAMGVVYLAEETELDRQVAVKIIAPHLLTHPGFRERFTREARALAKLNSGHVVQVYRYGEEGGSLFIATQLVPDGDLGRLLETDGVPPVTTALDLVAQVAEGLADAHDAGLIHRDIKPGNILIRRREVGVTAYLGDFGIARAAGDERTAALTNMGTAVGTPAFMAPELHVGDSATVASDIYSMGCLLWVTLTGAVPYEGSTPFEVVTKHVEMPVPQLAGSGPVIDGLNRILAGAMAKQPHQRYASARDLRQDLLRVHSAALSAASSAALPLIERRREPPAGALPVTAIGSGPSQPTYQFAGAPPAGGGGRGRRYGILAAVGVLVILLVVVGVLLATGGGGGGDDADDDPTPVPTRAADAPKDATAEEFCSASTESATASTGDYEAEAESAHAWAERAIEIGTPADMSEDERRGFELWVGYQQNITAEQLREDRGDEAWQEDFGFGEAADVFQYLGYLATTCTTT